jgi:glycosyltransferase involved in cell wall biosynthesis
MAGKPQISVILPFFEGGRWLGRSVPSVLAQEGLSFELLVIDDGSRSSPAERLQSFRDGRLRFIRIDHAGKGAALNCGAGEALAEILCFIDQDDVMLPGRLKKQFDGFALRPGTEAVYSDYERVRQDGRPIDRFVSRQASGEDCLQAMAEGRGLVSMQTLMIRRDAFRRIGGFSCDAALTGLDDAEFFARLFASGTSLVYVPGVVQQWTLHEGNYSGSAAFQEAREVLLEHLVNLADRYPSIAGILPRYRYHNTCARGLYFLEKSMPHEAAEEFAKMIRLRPFAWSGYYLWAKSCLKKTLAHPGTESRS